MTDERTRAADTGSELALADTHPELMQQSSWVAIEAEVKKHVAPDATQVEWDVFKMTATTTELDPRLGEIMCLSFGGKYVKVPGKQDEWVNQYTPYIGIAGVRKIAARTGRLDGTDGPYWCGPDGNFVQPWLNPEPPVAARFTVYALNAITGQPMSRPFHGVITMKRARWYKDKKDNNKLKLMGMWQTDPALIMAKCAEVEAYKRAGLFTNVQLMDRGFAEEAGEFSIIEERPGRVNAGRKLHAIAARRGVGHEGARASVQFIEPEIESLSEADADIQNEAADLLDVLDAEGVSEVTGVDADDVQGEPVDVAATPNTEGKAITKRTLDWFQERIDWIDFRALGDDDAALFDARQMLSESEGKELAKRVALCYKPGFPPDRSATVAEESPQQAALV